MTRGRTAHAPAEIPARGWLDIAWRIYTRIGENRIGLIAAGVAFYGLLSLFPAITAGVALVGLAFDANLLLAQSDWLLSAAPEAAGEMISTQMSQVASAREDTLGWAALIALAIAFWSASRGMGSLIQGLNAVYEEHEKRGFFRLRAMTIGLTVALILGLALSLTVVAAIPAALSLLGDWPLLRDAALFLRWPVMVVFGIGGIALLYRFGPSRRRATWRWLSPGAVLACLLWVAATLGFSFYVQRFGSYNETFGTLGGVVIMLTWLWLSAFVILLGALLNAEIEAQTGEDTTGEPLRPMGQRGAVKADTLGRIFPRRRAEEGTETPQHS